MFLADFPVLWPGFEPSKEGLSQSYGTDIAFAASEVATLRPAFHRAIHGDG